MKISVIIPVYNGEKTIARAVNSALNQTLSDIEIIIVNDGSADKTTDIINSLTDSRITVINQKNSGQGYARNAGLSVAHGEYIGFLDADDTIEPKMYEIMYDMAKERGADIVQCNITDIYPDGRTTVQMSDFEGGIDVADNAWYMSRYVAGYIHSYEVCNKIFKREFLNKNNLRFKDTKKYYSEDILFNMEAVKYLKRICFIKEPYYNYYQRGDSHMRSDAQGRLEKMIVLFDDYLKNADGAMRGSAANLAAMTTMYNVGKCKGLVQLPRQIETRLSAYISMANRRQMPLKKRAFLIAVRHAGKKQRIKLAKYLSKD